MKVELFPVIEIGFKEEESHFVQPFPDNNYWLSVKDWERNYEDKVRENGYEAYQRIKKGYPFYHVNQFNSKKDLLKIINLHLGGEEEKDRIPLAESCALFGGYVLSVDTQIIFTPQCCSLLSDISDWKTIIQDKFEEGYICLEGHPSPQVKRIGNTLAFTFEEEWEDFIPPAINSIVNRDEMILAIERCLAELGEFAYKLDALAEAFDHLRISDTLIFGEE